MVDRRIYVVGFSLYGSIHGPCEYQVTIQIIHTGSERLLGKCKIFGNFLQKKFLKNICWN